MVYKKCKLSEQVEKGGRKIYSHMQIIYQDVKSSKSGFDELCQRSNTGRVSDIKLMKN